MKTRRATLDRFNQLFDWKKEKHPLTWPQICDAIIGGQERLKRQSTAQWGKSGQGSIPPSLDSSETKLEDAPAGSQKGRGDSSDADAVALRWVQRAEQPPSNPTTTWPESTSSTRSGNPVVTVPLDHARPRNEPRRCEIGRAHV